MANKQSLRDLKARVIDCALEEARTSAAYSKTYRDENQPYQEPLLPKVADACRANLAALHALEQAGRTLYAELQARGSNGKAAEAP